MGAAPRQANRRRAKATPPVEAPAEQIPAPPPKLAALKEASPLSRTLASARAKKSPAAKKNLQQQFQENAPKDAPKWDLGDLGLRGGTLFRVLLLLLLAAAGISTILRSFRESERPFPEVPSSGRDSEVESFMKKTTQWIHHQLDVFDERILREIVGVRAELVERIHRNTQQLESDFRRLKFHVESVETSIRRLYADELISRDEAQELITLAIEQRPRHADENSLSLEDVRAAARKLVQAELERHSADGIGRVDFALGSGGGKVVHHSEPVFQGFQWILGAFLKHPAAHRILSPSFGEPGQCLPLKGANVSVDVRLRNYIHPEAVTLEHLSKRVAYDASSAPREFQVFGWSERDSPGRQEFGPGSSYLLGEFSYELDKGSIQTFNLEKAGVVAGVAEVNMIRLHVRSNYGGPHTCLYRLRVHGTEIQRDKL